MMPHDSTWCEQCRCKVPAPTGAPCTLHPTPLPAPADTFRLPTCSASSASGELGKHGWVGRALQQEVVSEPQGAQTRFSSETQVSIKPRSPVKRPCYLGLWVHHVIPWVMEAL